jgi:hypothetical protein
MGMTLTYTLISARSTFRNTRFVIFTMALPLVMYLLFNGLYGQQQESSSGLTAKKRIASWICSSLPMISKSREWDFRCCSAFPTSFARESNR